MVHKKFLITKFIILWLILTVIVFVVNKIWPFNNSMEWWRYFVISFVFGIVFILLFNLYKSIFEDFLETKHKIIFIVVALSIIIIKIITSIHK